MQEHKNIYFLSDFHLGLDSKTKSKDREVNIVRFLQNIENDAKILILLGDIFDFWFEYKEVVQKGFVRFQAQLAKLIEHGVKVYYFVGNHDLWQKDYFEQELGIKIFRDKYRKMNFDDKIFVIGHGDGLDDTDTTYKVIYKIFSSKFMWKLFSLLGSHIGMKLAFKWSQNNRKKHYKYDMQDLKDKEPMYKFCVSYEKQHKVDYFIFGHRHIVKLYNLPQGAKYINTGSWLYDMPYAMWDGNELIVKRFA